MPSLNHCDLLRHVGVNNLPKVVTRQRRGRELNSQPASCKSDALATRLLSHPHCAGWGPSSPSPAIEWAQPPIFGPCLLRPNGCMNQDATWYDDSLRPAQRCVRCGPSSTRKGHSPPKVGTGCIVTWRPSSPLPKGA